MIIFGCNDAGPAKYLALMSKLLNKKACYYPTKLSDFQFNQYDIKPLTSLNIDQTDLVITGTSFGETQKSIDKKLVDWANTNSITSVSIIEHWSWYKKRFEIKKGLLLPDYILVNDLIAKNEAIKDGLPENLLKPLGNIYLEELFNRKLKFESQPVNVKNRFDLPLDKKIIFFISESLKKSFPKTDQNYLGYDEYSVIKSIKEILPNCYHFVIKKHPEEDNKKYNHFIDSSTSIINKEITLSEISSISYKIIGMASMLLLELSTFRDDIISYRPNAKKKFIGDTLKVTIPVSNASDLMFAIENKITSEGNLKNYFLGSSKRIINFIQSIL